jgi:hypothetical protein
MLIELGVFESIRHGPLYVWAYVDEVEIIYVHTGSSSDIKVSSGELNQAACEKSYPGLWELIQHTVQANSEVDNGI